MTVLEVQREILVTGNEAKQDRHFSHAYSLRNQKWSQRPDLNRRPAHYE